LRARIEAARRDPFWTGVEGTVLVRRERWLVHADSDQLLTAYRGDTFQTGSASLANDRVPLLFCVDADGDLAFFERVGSPRTWCDVLAKRARRVRAAE
jgi:hypothetical protein